MLVAVVTAYYKETTEVLRRCYDSVKAQTHPNVVHIMVSDGVPNPEVDNWDVVHAKLPPSGDCGDTPRAVGGLIASNLGADALCMLDADNYYDPDHIETLLDLQKQSGAHVVTATRMLIRMDGTTLGVCKESDGNHFNDTNCYLLTKPAFGCMASWGFKDKRESLTGDRIFWATIKRSGAVLAHSVKPTINYVTSFAYHYQVNGEKPPEGAKVIVKFAGEQFSKVIPFEEYERLTQQQPK